MVIQIPNQDVPVYRIQNESGDQIIKTLHRNMLLPFSAIPSKLVIPETLTRPQRPRNVARNFQDENISEYESDSDNSDSETHSVVQYILWCNRGVKGLVGRMVVFYLLQF